MKAINVAIAIALITAAVQAEDRFDKTFSRSLTYHGGKVTVENRFGDIKIHTGHGNNVVLRATIRSSDAEIGRAINIEMNDTAGGISIKTVVPEIHRHGGSLSFSIDEDLTVPDEAPLHVTNHFGSIDAAGLRAASELVSRQGSITLRDSGGHQRLESSFGSITVEHTNGDVDATSANGSITARHIDGKLSATNRFGSIAVSNVKGDVSATNANGSVEVHDVGGSAAITNGFGSTRFSNIGRNLTLTSKNGRIDGKGVAGTVSITGSFATIDLKDVGGTNISNGNGDITVTDVRGNLTVGTSFGQVRAERVRGSLTVSNGNGSVTGTDIAGNAHVKDSFGSVFLKGVDGDVDVKNQNGGISVAGLRGACNPVTLHTSFSSIKVAVPAKVGYNVEARTTFGSINAEVPINAARRSEDTLTGTINGGGCKMELVTANGSVTITGE